MRRATLAALTALTLFAAGCGQHNPPAPATPPAPHNACQAGVMGGCVPPASPISRALGVPLAAAATVRQQLPDVSEYQGCTGPSGPFIYRVYEAGTGLQDASAVCHSRDAARVGWSGVYYFARPGSCIAQAQRALAIVRALPHRPNVIVVDAEVPLPRGTVTCADRTIHAGGFTYVNYTAPGLAYVSGGPFAPPVWVADYGVLAPAPVEGIRSRVAWQYSEAEYCKGIYGDCSWNEGITRLGVTAPAAVRRAALLASIHRLARWQAHWKCGQLRKPARTEHWCGGWENQKLALRRRLAGVR